MGKIVIAEIKENYPTYLELLITKKFILQDTIAVEKHKKNHASFLCVEDIAVKHSTLSNEINFIA